MKAAAARVEAQQKAGETPGRSRSSCTTSGRRTSQKEFEPDARTAGQGLGQGDGGPSGRLSRDRQGSRRAGADLDQTIELIFGVGFFAGGRMLIGMGLMKLGVFSASRSWRFYWTMAALGYGIGLPLMVFDAFQLIEHQFSVMYELHGGDVLQRVRQRDRGAGARRDGDADREVRRARLADQPAGGRGPDGPDQLSDPLDRLHDALLRLRLRPVRHDQPHRAGRDRAGHLDRSSSSSARSG